MAKMTFTIQDTPFTIDYPDEMEGQLTEIMAEQMGYRTYVPNPDYQANPNTEPAQIENPQSKLEFVVNRVVERLLNDVKSFTIAKQTMVAQQQIKQQVDASLADVSITKG